MIPEPYEGQEAYIFISYAHRDKEQVFQVLNALQERGYRFWYDDGIAPGSEWPEDIGRHLDGAAMVIAFVTPLSMASTNCRREINFALAREKPFLSVILEPTDMPVGMELQLSSQRSVVRYNYPSWETFMSKILACPGLVPCRIPEGEQPAAAAQPAVETAPPVTLTATLPETQTGTQLATQINAQILDRDETLLTTRISAYPAPRPETKPVTQPVPTPKTEKRGKAEKKNGRTGKKPLLKRPLFWILTAVLALALLLFLPRWSGSGSGRGELGFSWGGSSYTNGHLNLYGKTFSQQDLVKIAGLADLKSLSLNKCDLSACDLGAVRFATASLNAVELKDCTGVDSFRFLEGQPLQRVDLSGCAGFTDLSKLDCSRIYNLRLAGTGVSDLSPLRGAPLTSLTISDTAVTDLGPLAESQSLTVLEAENCPIDSIEVLAGLQNLTDLNCSGCPIKTVKGEFQSLRMSNLRMANCGVEDLSGFVNFTALKTLDLSGNPGLTSLEWLHEKNGVTLESVDLSYTGLKREELAFLAGCAGMKELSLSGIELENLDFCADMRQLTMIRAEGCGLRDISRLPCSKLEKALLAFNSIGEIGCLAALPMSPEPVVDLSFNGLEDASALPGGKYAALLLCGNGDKLPATLRSNLEGKTLALSWSEDIQKELRFSKGAFLNLYMTGCPATELLDLQESLGSPYLKAVTVRELMGLLAEGKVNRPLQTSYTALLPLFGDSVS